MKIKATVGIAGTRADNGERYSWSPGQEVEVSDEWGKALCKGGSAVPVGKPKAKRTRKATAPKASEADGAETRKAE